MPTREGRLGVVGEALAAEAFLAAHVALAEAALAEAAFPVARVVLAVEVLVGAVSVDRLEARLQIAVASTRRLAVRMGPEWAPARLTERADSAILVV